MAQKQASNKTKKPEAKSKAPAGKQTARAAKVAPETRSRRAAPTRAAASKAERKPVKAAPRAQPVLKERPAPRPVRPSISLDRRLDIIGILLAFAGLLTLLSMLSGSQGASTGRWIGWLAQVFGWARYLFPLGLLGVGLWLVLRSFERIPQLSFERLLGLLLLYANLLAWLHLAQSPANRAVSYELAVAGQGGGYGGALLFELLRGALGLGGAVIALVAWLLIGLALTLDVSILDLFRWFPPLLARAQDWWDERRAGQAETPNQTPAYTGYSPPPPVNFDGRPATAGISPAASPAPAAATFAAHGEQGRAWVLPPADQILESGGETSHDDDYDRQRARLIEETLASFGAPANVVEINRGPTITQFGVEPDFVESRNGRTRVRVGKIAALADDLALALSARTIRIQAPVPGKGFVGIEVPNDEIALVALRDVIESEAFRRLKPPLRFALGQDVSGEAVAADMSGMPHLLIAGATGSGKSVCVNALIASFLMFNTPDDLRLIMVDPKRVELTGYNGIPHLLAPVVVEMERVVAALQWVTREMDKRYHKLAQAGCRNIAEYNAKRPQPRRAPPAAPGGVHRRAGRPDDAGARRDRAHHHPPGAAGPRHRHPPGDRHAAPVGGRGHRPDQGQLPGAHRLRRGLGRRQPRDPRPARRRAPAGAGRHALPGAGRPRAGAPAGGVRLGYRDHAPGVLLAGTGWRSQPGTHGSRRRGRHPAIRRAAQAESAVGRYGNRGERRPAAERGHRPGAPPGAGVDLHAAAPAAHRLHARRPPDRDHGGQGHHRPGQLGRRHAPYPGLRPGRPAGGRGGRSVTPTLPPFSHSENGGG